MLGKQFTNQMDTLVKVTTPLIHMLEPGEFYDVGSGELPDRKR